GCFVASLGELCVWLGEQAEALGCDVLPGTAAAEVLYRDDCVAGVITGDLGLDRTGARTSRYTPGYELRGKYVIFAEGCHGHLGRSLEQRFALRAEADPPHYGIGIKEVWEIDAARHRPGHVLHTVGWPLRDTDGGGFLYHAAGRRVYAGFITS